MKSLSRIDRKLVELDRLYGSTPQTSKKTMDWAPFDGAQSLAFHCPADETFYGGQPGGGKTDLILGLALTAHQRSLILRRRSLDMAAIKQRFQELTHQTAGNENRIGRRLIQFGGCKDESSKYKFQGQPHDLKGFDEVNQFTQSQYEYIKTWNRTPTVGQRCRTVCSFNPPTSPEQRWVLDYLAPWLNPKHPNPAVSGELRYYLGDQEVDGPEPVEVKGKLLFPTSRCFILSSTADNPLLTATGYQRLLDNLPEHLRALMSFADSIQDDPYQVIPTKWVEDAQQRWRDRFGDGQPPAGMMDAIAADPSRGGGDEFALAMRYSDAIFVAGYPGNQIPDGIIGAEKVLLHRRNAARILVDVIGVGSSTFDQLKLHGYEPLPYMGSNDSLRRDRTGQFGFANKRAESYWLLREALDPAYRPTLALPPDAKVLAELTAPRWHLSFRGIQLEGKDEIRKRLGRSTNYADAIVMVTDTTLQYHSCF